MRKRKLTEEQKANLEFLENWKRVGPILEEIRWKELREFRHEDKWEIVESLLEIGFVHRQPRKSSGLVELQKLLHRKKN